MPADRLQAHRADVPDMSAELIAQRRFSQTWRGYDPDEVKDFLAQVAEQVRLLRDRVEAEVSARREAEQRALHPRIDEATLMSAVGEETAAILRSARSAAGEITARAEASAQTLVAEAEARSKDLVAGTEALVARRAEEAEAGANETWEKALAEAEDVRQSARQEAQAFAEEAAQKGQESVEAAEAVREKILTDLARRRKLATVQIEQLRAGRERLLDAYLVVRRTLDEVTDELQRADAEARAAAVAVGRLDRDEQTGELVDLRRQEHWDSLEAFGGAEGGAPSGGQRADEVTAPVVLAPKVTQVAGASTPPLASGKARPNERPGPDETSVVSGTDAVESVRIVRPGTGGPGPENGAVSEVATASMVVETEAVPSPAEDAGDDQRGQGREAGDVEAAGADTSAPGGAGDEPNQGKDVQGLFARLREDRAQATRAARKTLLDTEAPAAAQANGDETVAESPSEVASSLAPNRAAASTDMPATPLGTEAGPGAVLLERRDEVARDVGPSLARKLKRALQDEQNSLLDRLRNLKNVTPENLLPDPDEHPEHFAQAGRPLLQEAALAGANQAAALSGGGTPGSDLGPQTIDDLADELGRAIAEPLRQRLELAMSSAGDDPAELAGALGAAYREWKTQRIEATAYDEVAAAFARGTYLTFPEGALLRWVVGPSEGPCPDCEDNALAGDQPKGEEWPTGQLHPPAHPGCRCALAPAGGEGSVTMPATPAFRASASAPSD